MELAGASALYPTPCYFTYAESTLHPAVLLLLLSFYRLERSSVLLVWFYYSSSERERNQRLVMLYFPTSVSHHSFRAATDMG